MRAALLDREPDHAPDPTPAAAAPPAPALLAVDDLSVEFVKGGRTLRIVDGVSFAIGRAERVALVGESGSGKSVTAQALIRLNPHARITGRVTLAGRDLLTLGERQLADIRGARIGMAFQDAMTSLNPIMPVGAQIMETLRIRGVSRTEARERTVAILSELGVAGAAERLNAYVHEFSGGMRQRVVLAMALIAAPDLLIADEPTTALDVRVQQQVLDVLDEFAARHALSVLLITHDLGIVASFADRVLVMYSGRVVEDAPVNAIFAAPLHPYTIGLLAAVPRVDRNAERLAAVPGTPVAPSARPSGCAFHPRCAFAVDRCRVEVPMAEWIGARRVACHRARELHGAPRAV